MDKGAIRFVLSGANIMCPGLTSPGASLNLETEEGDAVAVMAEGKSHAGVITFHVFWVFFLLRSLIVLRFFCLRFLPVVSKCPKKPVTY